MGEGEVSGFFFASQVDSAMLSMALYWSVLIKDSRLHLMYLKRVPDTSVSKVDQYRKLESGRYGGNGAHPRRWRKLNL